MRNKGITITSENAGPIFRRAVKALRKADRDYRKRLLDFPRPYTYSKKAGEKIIEIVKKHYDKSDFYIAWPPSVQYKVFYGGKITMRDLKNMV